MTFLSAAISLFLIMNALGNVPLFVALLAKYDVQRQKRIIFRELLIALGILLIFSYFGNWIMDAMGISQPIIGISGGILLIIIALGMIFPRPGDKTASEDLEHEPFVVPLAMPIITGPGSIATVMVYSEQIDNLWIMTGIILAAWIPSLIILFLSANIKHLLGQKGVLAMQKFGGMLICLIAIHMLVGGILSIVQTTFHIVPK